MADIFIPIVGGGLATLSSLTAPGPDPKTIVQPIGGLKLPINLPNYRPSTETRTTDAFTLNLTATTIEQQRQTQVATNRKFGVVYGTTSLAAKLDVFSLSGGYYYFRAILCVGEISSIDSVSMLGKAFVTGAATADPDYVGDWSALAVSPGASVTVGQIFAHNSQYYECIEAFTAYSVTGNYTPTGSEYSPYFAQVLENVDINTYTGTTSQTVDPLMVELFGAGYTETLTGTYAGTDYGLAYVTGKIPAAQITDSAFPSVLCAVTGKKVYDPDTLTTAYSANGALCLADFITNNVYGKGLSVDWDSVSAAKTRAYNVNTSYNAAPLSATDVMQTLTAYASVFLRYEGGEYVFVVDGPASSSGTIKWSGGDANLAEIPTLYLANWAQRANLIRVYYTDGTKEKAVEVESATVTATTDEPRVQEYRMPGLNNLTEATRFATERLAELEDETLTVSFTLFHEGLLVKVGSVWTMTINYPHQTILTSQDIRITSRRHIGVGLWQFQGRQYSADSYEAV